MRIKEAREAIDWTQTELAELTGIPQPRLSLIETGGAEPTPGQKVALSRALGVSIAELFGGVS